jgi:hypothetical protein
VLGSKPNSVTDHSGTSLEKCSEKDNCFEFVADAQSLNQYINNVKTESLTDLLARLGREVISRGEQLHALEKEVQDIHGSQDSQDHQICGLVEEPSDQDMEETCRKLSARLHPDKCGDEAAVTDLKQRPDELKPRRQESTKIAKCDGNDITWDSKDRGSMIKAHSDLHMQLAWITKQLDAGQFELRRLHAEQRIYSSIANEPTAPTDETSTEAGISDQALSTSSVKSASSTVHLARGDSKGPSGRSEDSRPLPTKVSTHQLYARSSPRPALNSSLQKGAGQIVGLQSVRNLAEVPSSGGCDSPRRRAGMPLSTGQTVASSLQRVRSHAEVPSSGKVKGSSDSMQADKATGQQQRFPNMRARVLGGGIVQPSENGTLSARARSKSRPPDSPTARLRSTTPVAKSVPALVLARRNGQLRPAGEAWSSLSARESEAAMIKQKGVQRIADDAGSDDGSEITQPPESWRELDVHHGT